MICIKPAFSLHVSINNMPVNVLQHCRHGTSTAEEAPMRSRIFLVLLAWLALLVGEVSTACANDLTRSVTTRDLAVHYGVVPASSTVAPGGSSDEASRNVNLYRLTVALFDRSTGKRIENAHVVAVVRGPRSEASSLHATSTRIQLAPARDGNAVTYGNVFDARWKGVYHIDLMITRDGIAHPEHVRLNYDQQF
ncbi:hypothetical protein [Burkholderia thailandensis]|nr:hypothetical protein [Burkholderia thailandensis]MCS3394581.1 hypothetical protein [Burkholderia thailandensis]MCS6427663.1 hypothetical protein [Burkholderia thailandensis]MCS6455893.1 hypothetical protein [Burkholderia thailandensis]MCS6466828.1 hypothetical protein [Burkholderia thailandensis]MCS6485524.1 hypothetical protein [Burkholderia thailandensis]